MRISSSRVARLVSSAAFVALPLAACAAIGGGGDETSDCDSDVSGSEFTPVATADFEFGGTSCNNNAFVDADLDAYAYPPAGGVTDLTTVLVGCEDVGEGNGSSYTLFKLVNGVPQEWLAGECDDTTDAADATSGDEFVLVIEHTANSDITVFSAFLTD